MVSYFVSSIHSVLISGNILKRLSQSFSCTYKLRENCSWQVMPVVCTCLVVATPNIQCVHGRDQLQAVLNTVMNLLLPQEARYFRTSLSVVIFSRRHLALNGKRLEPYCTCRRSQIAVSACCPIAHPGTPPLYAVCLLLKSVAHSTCPESFSSGRTLSDLRQEQLVFLDPLDTPSLWNLWSSEDPNCSWNL
jgi:hypothetical protein